MGVGKKGKFKGHYFDRKLKWLFSKIGTIKNWFYWRRGGLKFRVTI